jgi:Arm DNA-binding domain
MPRGFTPISIDKTKAGAVRREIPDAGARGLYLVVQPSGRKSFACRYRFGGKAYKLTLGDASIGVATARKLTAAALAEVAQGRATPSMQKKRTSEPRWPNRTPTVRRYGRSPNYT